MKKKSIIIVAIVFVIFGTMAWTLANNKREINRKKEVKATDNRIAVTVATAKMQETSNQLELVGITEPVKEVVLVSESAGKIIQINFNLGDLVSKGALLAKVDDTYKQLAFENAQLNYNKNKEDYERNQVLRKGDAVSEDQLRNAKVSFESSVIQLGNARKQLEDTKVIAPFTGIIALRNAELGSYVNTGSSIAGIADIAQLKILLTVSETNVYQLSKGQVVNISADVYPGVIYKGNISGTSPQGSNTHTFPVEVIMENKSKNPLKAGTYVKVHVELGNRGTALLIPRNAIVSSVKDPSVYMVKGDSVQLIKINIGEDYDSYIEVLSGIKEGDQVVTNGQINLMNGARVSVIQN